MLAENMSRKTDILGSFEHLVLAAAARLKDSESGLSHASGNSVTEEIGARTGRQVTVGAVSNTLDRLEKKGHLTSEVSDRETRRPRRYYNMTEQGKVALVEARQVVDSIWKGLELPGAKRPALNLKATAPPKRRAAAGKSTRPQK
jgi:PadR family transcriptional regulator PadR